MKRRALVLAGALTLAMLASACTTTSGGPPGASTGAPATPTPRSAPPSAVGTPEGGQTAGASQSVGDALFSLPLVDVRTGEAFTLGDLAEEKPVLIETMAIWCVNCKQQQREVLQAHAQADFHSVGIDVDPNERPADLAAYAEREGFDWRYVMADAQLVDLLTDRYGFAVTNPPSMPTFIAYKGEVRALEFGRLRSADELVAELASG